MHYEYLKAWRKLSFTVFYGVWNYAPFEGNNNNWSWYKDNIEQKTKRCIYIALPEEESSAMVMSIISKYAFTITDFHVLQQQQEHYLVFLSYFLVHFHL